VDQERTHWIELPAHRSSIGVARRSVGTRLKAWSLPGELCSDAVLLLSELATNARILCGIGLVTDTILRLEVHDHDHSGPTLRRCRAALDDEGGRGLFLVEELADTWGVDRSRLTGGNAVWANLSA
jgi:anti-sigma regulatory factor (Ser/Thr protein kinase)